MAKPRKQSALTLRYDCLSFPEVLAQSVANISPSATPILTVVFVFASAGTGTWLAYLLATIGMILVCLNINQFARRSASSGLLYTYIARGLGTTVGAISGWSLALAYLITGMAVICAFSLFAGGILETFKLSLSPIFLYAIVAGIAWYFAYKDIRLSTVSMFWVEVASVTIILLLGAIVLFQKGVVDVSQLRLEGMSFQGLSTALVLAILAFTGFESATALGEEAKNPLKSIPRAVIWSTVLSGIFFTFMAYVEVLAFEGGATPLSKSDSPLSVLAVQAGLGFFAPLIAVAAMLTYFSATLACLNAGSRLLFLMARHGIFPAPLGQAHRLNRTPYVAVSVLAVVMFLVPAAMSLFNVSTLDSAVSLATIGTYGFLVAYVLVSIAAPVYLYRLKNLRPLDVVISILAIGIMALPIIGSVADPTSAKFFYLFLLLLGVGGGWFLILRLRSPEIISDIERDIATIDYKFTEMKDLPQEALVAAIETDFYNFYASFGFFPNGELHEAPNLSWYVSGIPFYMCNGIIRARLDPDNLDARIETILQPFKARKLPLMWAIPPSSQPPNLGKSLEAHGLIHNEDWIGMALDLSSWQEPADLPEGLTITQVKDIETLRLWVHPLTAAFRTGDDVAESYADGLALSGVDDELPWRYYLGWLDGQPVASSMVLFEEGFAGISAIGTIPEVRRRGIGKAITQAALGGAKARGYRVAVLQATPAGANVYRQLGFQDYCQFGIYMKQF